MERHVRLLGSLASLGGKLAMLLGVSMLLLSAGALAEMVKSPDSGVEFAAGVTAAVFAVIGAFALLWGGAHVWAAVLLARRQPFGRVLPLLIGQVLASDRLRALHMSQAAQQLGHVGLDLRRLRHDEMPLAVARQGERVHIARGSQVTENERSFRNAGA